jgi:hypothetical protein
MLERRRFNPDVTEEAILIWVSEDRFVKRVPPFVLTARYVKSSCRFSDAIDFRGKVPPLIMEE